jgi:hypothetical protein
VGTGSGGGAQIDALRQYTEAHARTLRQNGREVSAGPVTVARQRKIDELLANQPPAAMDRPTWKKKIVAHDAAAIQLLSKLEAFAFDRYGAPRICCTAQGVE